MKYKQLTTVLIAVSFFYSTGFAQPIDFSKATIFIPEKKNIQHTKSCTGFGGRDSETH